MKDKIKLDKSFDEKNIYLLLFNLRCCGGHFSNITLIDAKAKYRSPYLFWGCPQHVLGT